MLRNGRIPDNKFSANQAFNHALQNSTPMPPKGVVAGVGTPDARHRGAKPRARRKRALSLGLRSSLHSLRRCRSDRSLAHLPGTQSLPAC